MVDVDKRSQDVREPVPVGYSLIQVETPAQCAAGEIMYKVLGHELYQIHIHYTAISQDGNYHVDHEEHQQGTAQYR